MAARLNALRDRPAEAVASPVLPRFPDTLPSRASLDSMSAGGRPMIRAGLEEVRAADASATLARRELVPDLQLGVQYGQRGTTMLGVDPVMGPTSERITERMGSLMIGATLPIFARSRQIQMRLEASAMKAMAEADVASMRAETRGRIGEVYADLERSRNLTRLYRATVLPQAEAAVSSATSAYRVGKVDLMTLLDDRMAVNRYRQELYTLQADEGKAWAELEMLVGRELLDSDSVAPVAPVAPAAPAGGVDQGTGGPR
jgi:cobalt-zinc-cadmium efflux system outer membrane protein